MTFTIEIDREVDGRWIAEILGIPGALAYGVSPDEAIAHATALGQRILADRQNHGETAN